MFRSLRLKRQPEAIQSLPVTLTGERLARDAETPVSIQELNHLPEKTKQRAYRGLLPASLLALFKIDLVTWKAAHDAYRVDLKAEAGTGVVKVSIVNPVEETDVFASLELQDNAFGSIDLNLVVLNDPKAPRFGVDYDAHGEPTLFGALRRNLAEEARARQAGLAPGQVRAGLGLSRAVFEQLEGFLGVLGHRAYFLEPLSYASAWVFERRGLAYVRGHKLMDDIHAGFQPGGPLCQALDGSTPFRQTGQEKTVRGRAWAIHDGILSAIDQRWDKLRMVKQIGQHAGVETFVEAVY